MILKPYFHFETPRRFGKGSLENAKSCCKKLLAGAESTRSAPVTWQPASAVCAAARTGSSGTRVHVRARPGPEHDPHRAEPASPGRPHGGVSGPAAARGPRPPPLALLLDCAGTGPGSDSEHAPPDSERLGFLLTVPRCRVSGLSPHHAPRPRRRPPPRPPQPPRRRGWPARRHKTMRVRTLEMHQEVFGCVAILICMC